jgi:tetratricopeptide (TPR) repeat protein
MKWQKKRPANTEAVPTAVSHAWLFGLLLVVITLIAYGPVWHAGFIWDDDEYVTENPLLTAPDGLRRIWFSLDSPSQYFPLTYTTFYVERHLWGLNPTGYHLVWWERHHQGRQGEGFEIGPMERVLIASRALWFYAGKLLWPSPLIFSYPRWKISVSDLGAYLWVLVTAGLGVVIWRVRRWTGRSVEVAAVYFAAILSPVLGFIMLYTFLYSFVADHYQYLACIGPLALAAAGMKMGLGRVLQPVLGAVLLIVLGILTWQQCEMYANAETLWQTTLRQNPNSWMAQNNLGDAFVQKSEVDEAMVHFRKALEIKPDYAEASYNLGLSLRKQGRLDEAIGHFQKALALQPKLRRSPKWFGQQLCPTRPNGGSDCALPKGGGTQAGLCRSPQESRLDFGHLSAGCSAQRQEGGRTGRTSQSTHRRRKSAHSLHPGGGLCGKWAVFRSGGNGATRPVTGRGLIQRPTGWPASI